MRRTAWQTRIEMFERQPAPLPPDADVPPVIASMAEGNAVNYWLHVYAATRRALRIRTARKTSGVTPDGRWPADE